MLLSPRLPALACAVVLALPAAAFAETITVSDISVTGPDGLTLTIPTIETVDANLDEAGIRALFTDYSGTLASLATLSAASIRIPSLVMSYEVPGIDGSAPQRSEVTYSEFTLSDVVDGIANGGATLGSIAVHGPGAQSFTVGTMSASYLDFGGIIAFYGLGGDTAGSGAFVPLYKDFTVEGMTFADGERMSCTIGPISAKSFSARPLKHSFTEMMAIGREMEAAEASDTEPSSESIAKALAIYTDMLTAFESTPSTLDGLDCTGTDEKGNAVTLNAGAFNIGGFLPGIYPSISLDGFRFDVANDGWMEFGNFTWKKMDLNGPIAVIEAAAGAINEKWFETNWRKLIPALDGLSIAGFSMDIPDAEKPGGRMIASVGGFDVSLADYINGIPTTIATKGTDISFKVPDDEEGRMLRAAGVDTLNLGFDLALHWNEADNTISVDSVAISGTDLGTIALKGVVGNATDNLFAENLGVATVAAMALTVKELTIDIDNAGMAELLLAASAAEQKVPPEAMHAQFMAMARALPIGILGASQEAIGLGDALGSFLAGAPQISITLTAKEPRGISLIEFMAAQENPAMLQGKFTVTATASGEPVPYVFPEISLPAVEPAPLPAPTEPTAPAEEPGNDNAKLDAKQ